MILSPTDFQAFSDATGADYPTTPAEKAKLAPVVADWKAQVTAQQQQNRGNGALAATAGLLGAAGLSGLGLWAYNHFRKQGIDEPTAAGLAKQAQADAARSGPKAPITIDRAPQSVPSDPANPRIAIANGPSGVPVVRPKGVGAKSVGWGSDFIPWLPAKRRISAQPGAISPGDKRGTVESRLAGEYNLHSRWNDPEFGPLLRDANTPELQQSLIDQATARDPRLGREIAAAIADRSGTSFREPLIRKLGDDEPTPELDLNKYPPGTSVLFLRDKGAPELLVSHRPDKGAPRWVRGDAAGARARLAPTGHDAYGSVTDSELRAEAQGLDHTKIDQNRSEPGMRRPGYDPDRHALIVPGPDFELTDFAKTMAKIRPARSASSISIISPTNLGKQRTFDYVPLTLTPKAQEAGIRIATSPNGLSYIVDAEGVPLDSSQWRDEYGSRPLRERDLHPATAALDAESLEAVESKYGLPYLVTPSGAPITYGMWDRRWSVKPISGSDLADAESVLDADTYRRLIEDSGDAALLAQLEERDRDLRYASGTDATVSEEGLEPVPASRVTAGVEPPLHWERVEPMGSSAFNGERFYGSPSIRVDGAAGDSRWLQAGDDSPAGGSPSGSVSTPRWETRPVADEFLYTVKPFPLRKTDAYLAEAAKYSANMQAPPDPEKLVSAGNPIARAMLQEAEAKSVALDLAGNPIDWSVINQSRKSKDPTRVFHRWDEGAQRPTVSLPVLDSQGQQLYDARPATSRDLYSYEEVSGYDAPPYTGKITRELPAGDMPDEFTGKRSLGSAVADSANLVLDLTSKGASREEAERFAADTFFVPQAEVSAAVDRFANPTSPDPNRPRLAGAHAVGGHSSRDWLTQALSSLQITPREDFHTLQDLVLSQNPEDHARAAKSFLRAAPEIAEVIGTNLGRNSTDTKIQLVAEGLLDAADDYGRAVAWAEANDPELHQRITTGGEGAPTFEQFARPYVRRHATGAALELANAGAGSASMFQLPKDVGQLLALEAMQSNRSLDEVLTEKIGGAASPAEAVWKLDSMVSAVASNGPKEHYAAADRLAAGFWEAASAGDGSRVGALKQRLGASSQATYASQDPLSQPTARLPIALRFGLDNEGVKAAEGHSIASGGRFAVQPIVDPITNRVTGYKRAPEATDDDIRRELIEAAADPAINKLSGTQLTDWATRNSDWLETVRGGGKARGGKAQGTAQEGFSNRVLRNRNKALDGPYNQAQADFAAGLIDQGERDRRRAEVMAEREVLRSQQDALNSNGSTIQSILVGGNRAALPQPPRPLNEKEISTVLEAAAAAGVQIDPQKDNRAMEAWTRKLRADGVLATPRVFSEGTGYAIDLGRGGVEVVPDSRGPVVSYESLLSDAEGETQGAFARPAAVDLGPAPTALPSGISTWTPSDRRQRQAPVVEAPAPAASGQSFDLSSTLHRPAAEPAVDRNSWSTDTADDGSLDAAESRLRRQGYGSAIPRAYGERLSNAEHQFKVIADGRRRQADMAANPTVINDLTTGVSEQDAAIARASILGDYMDKLASGGFRLSKDGKRLLYKNQSQMKPFVEPSDALIAARVNALRRRGILPR